MVLTRAGREICPPVSLDTMKLVKTLELSVPVLAPPALFLRLKVNHPVVKKIIVELLSKFLSCICLNKQDMAGNDQVRNFVSRQSWGPNGIQNWAFVNNLRNPNQQQEEEQEEELKAEEKDGGLEGVVLEGEHRLEEALKLSLQSRGEKRKPEQGESSEEAGQAKRSKLEELEEKADPEAEEEQSSEGEEGKSIYSVEEESKPGEFPTILDVLSIDHEVVRSLLINRCQIDKHYIVPQFDKFIQYLNMFDTEDESIRLIGCDSDGKVVSVNPSQFNSVGDTIMGYMETPFTSSDQSSLLTAWGGPDITDRWPEFSRQLTALSLTEEKKKEKLPPRPRSSPVAGPSRPSSSSSSSSSTPKSETDILALLASRGVSSSVVKK